MALHDWNHNGHLDAGDDFFEYELYRRSGGSNRKMPEGCGSGCLGAIVAIVFLALLGAVIGSCGGNSTSVHAEGHNNLPVCIDKTEEIPPESIILFTDF